MISTHRNRARPGICTFVALTLAAASASAQFRPRPMDEPSIGEKYHVEAAASLWFPGTNISLASESLGIPGDLIDFKSDLGLMDKKLPMLELQLRPARRHKFRLEFIPIDFTQAAVLHRSLKFNGQLYGAGAPVNSELDWKSWRFGYEYDFIVRDRGFAGFITELKYTDITGTLTSGAIDEFTHAQAPIPAIGGIGRVYVVPSVSVTGEVTGVALPDKAIKSASGHYVDVDVYGTVNFTDNVGVKAGYRSMDLGYTFKVDSGTFTLRGLYFGLVLRY
jgi:hypothetical protein